MGSERISQLRRKDIYCPIHGHSKMAVLPSLSCPSCEVERGHSDLLRRSRRKERDWKRKQHEHFGSLEANGMDSATASGRSV